MSAKWGMGFQYFGDYFSSKNAVYTKEFVSIKAIKRIKEWYRWKKEELEWVQGELTTYQFVKVTTDEFDPLELIFDEEVNL